MTHEDARRLAEFVKDHDKRFEAKAKTDDAGKDSHVLLTRVADGTTREPITSFDQYRASLIEGDDPGPTVQAAWEKWGAGEPSVAAEG